MGICDKTIQSGDLTVKYSSLIPFPEDKMDTVVMARNLAVVMGKIGLAGVNQLETNPKDAILREILRYHLRQELTEGLDYLNAAFLSRMRTLLECSIQGLRAPLKLVDYRTKFIKDFLEKKRQELQARLKPEVLANQAKPSPITGNQEVKHGVLLQSITCAESENVLDPSYRTKMDAYLLKTSLWTAIKLANANNSTGGQTRNVGPIRMQGPFSDNKDPDQFTATFDWNVDLQAELQGRTFKSIRIDFGVLNEWFLDGPLDLVLAVRILHEATHRWGYTADFAYIDQAGYENLTPHQAVNNASSLAWWCASCHLGRVVRGEGDLR
jgi:hypothetical protein